MIHFTGSCEGLDTSKFGGIFPDECLLVFDNLGYNNPLEHKVYLFLQEPDIICPSHTEEVIKSAWKYEYIYTFNAKILAMFPKKSIKWPGNYATVKPSNEIKNFLISGWASTKIWNNASGHLLRLEIYNKQLQLPSNCIFFRSSNRNADGGPPLEEITLGQNPLLGSNFLGGGKQCLFEGFQFSIILENSQQENYFTEKIIDCLITKTIPLYWGCPNISEFFDTTGWLFFENFETLLQQVSTIDETYYSRYMNTINKNYNLAMKRSNFYHNIIRVHTLHHNDLQMGH